MLLRHLKCLRALWIKTSVCKQPFYLVILLQSSQAISQLFWCYNTFNRFYLVLKSTWGMCLEVLIVCKSIAERHWDLYGSYGRWSLRIFLWQTKPSPPFCLRRRTYLGIGGIWVENFGGQCQMRQLLKCKKMMSLLWLQEPLNIFHYLNEYLIIINGNCLIWLNPCSAKEKQRYFT